MGDLRANPTSLMATTVKIAVTS